MVVINFIKYCFKCLMIIFGAAFGDVSPSNTWKEYLTGSITLLIIVAIIILILCLTGVIKFKRK